MIIDAPEALRAWLTKEMAPICDAEPAALAKYVLALLRKDKPEAELMEFCIEQLDVFLQTKARSFVEKLFRVIKERSYITVSGGVVPTPLAAAPLSSVTHDKKKDIDERRDVKEKEKEKREDVKKKITVNQGEKEKEQQKVRDEKEGEKIAAVAAEPASVQPQKTVRKRISPPLDVPPREEFRRDHAANRFERRRSRSPRERRLERGDRNLDRRVVPPPARLQHRQMDRYKNDRPERLERKRSRSPRSPYERPRREKSTEPELRKKKRCRDYDEKGYCMKGDQCIYDHGPDPVVVDDIALEKMVTNGAKPAVAQIAPNFSVPPPGYTPLNPPPPGVDSVYATNSGAVASATLSEGYNPEAPALSAPSLPVVAAPAPAAPSLDFSVPPPPLPSVVANQPWRPTTYTVPAVSSVLIHPTTTVYDPTQSSVTAPSHNVTQLTSGQSRRGRGSSVGGLGRYGQNGSSANRTLQVRKIPAGMNNIAKLNEHFGQFGQIVNMQVCFDGDPEAALITYANRHEAVSAYKSTTPILNNRFIKVFWHNADGQASSAANSGQGISAGSSSVTFNARGSLTKTVHLGSRFTGSGSDQTLHASNLPGTESQGARSGNIQSQMEREKYIEIRRRRKQEKENRMRLLDLQHRKSDLMSKEIEQQKVILEKMKEPDITSEKKRKLYKIFKKIEISVTKTKAEIAELNEKLLKMKTDMEAKATADSLNSSNGAAETGIGVKRTFSEGELSVGEIVSPTKKTRLQDPSQTLDNRSTAVAVRGLKAGTENDVIVHMEHFGELVDMEFAAPTQDKTITAYFIYKKRRDAEQAVALGADFPDGQLEVEWAPKSGCPEATGVIPDEKRKPSERVTPAALLASCPLEESDDDGNED